MRLSISLLLAGFIAVGFAFPVALDQHGSSEEELEHGRVGSSSPEELLNPPSVPPTYDIPEIRTESEPWNRKRLRRNGLTPPAVFVTPNTNPNERKADLTKEERPERGEDADRVKRNGINPSYIPPTFGVGPAEAKEEEVEGSENTKDERVKRNGINPSYIPPTFGVGPAEAEDNEETGNKNEERVKRQVLENEDESEGRGLVTPPPFLPDENGERIKRQVLENEDESEGRGLVTPPPFLPDENGEHVKRQILENVEETGGRGLFTPPPFVPDENELLHKALIEHEIDQRHEGNQSEHDSDVQEMRRKRCSTCTEGKDRVGDEGTIETGHREEPTSGPFDSPKDNGKSNAQEELYERVRRHHGMQEEKHKNEGEQNGVDTLVPQDEDGMLTSPRPKAFDNAPSARPMRAPRSASIEKRKSQHPDHWSEDQDEMIEKILRHEVV
uniref:Uncharacterized protein n=1 Tax=Plectus sambesii TaxID=2011161 RepID=A0A914XBV7_9BILA